MNIDGEAVFAAANLFSARMALTIESGRLENAQLKVAIAQNQIVEAEAAWEKAAAKWVECQGEDPAHFGCALRDGELRLEPRARKDGPALKAVDAGGDDLNGESDSGPYPAS